MLALLADLDQYESFRAMPDHPGVSMASGDLQVLEAARRDGRSVHNLWTGYGSDEAFRNDTLAWDLCVSIAAEIRDRVVQGGCDIVERMKFDLFQPLRCVLHTNAMVASLLERTRADGVVCYGERSRSFIWDPIEQPPDVFNAVAAGAAERAGIHASLIARATVGGGQEPVRLLAPADPAPSRPLLDRRIEVVAICPAYDYVELELFLLSLPEEQRSRWLVVTDEERVAQGRIPGLVLRNAFGLRFRTDAAVAAARALPESFPLPENLPSDARAALADARVAFVWRHFRASLETGIRSHAFGRFLARATRPRLALIGHDTFGTARCLAEGIRECGVATLSNWHAGLGHEYNYRRHIDTRGPVMCWGEFDAELIRRYRRDGGPAIPVGSLRKDCSYRDLMLDGSSLRSAASRAPRIVFLTARVADIAEPLAQVETHQSTWEALIAFCRAKPDWAFVIKRHPRWDYNLLYRRLIEQGGVTNVELTDEPPARALAGASAAVLVNYPSSVAMDACAVRVPLLYLRHANFEWARGVIEDKGIATASGVAEAVEWLLRIVDWPRETADAVERQNRFMEKALAGTGAEAVRNVARAVRDRSRDAGDADPRDEWLLRVQVTLERFLHGAAAGGIGAAMAAHRNEAQEIDWGVEASVDPREWADHMMSRILRCDRVYPGSASRVALLSHLRDSLPARFRPSWSDMRGLLSHAFHQESAARPMQGRRGAWAMEAASLVLSPGRIRKRCRAVEVMR